MMTATTIAQWVIRLTGVTQVVLGLLFWTDRALALLPLHMAVGATFVLALWALAGLAGWAGLGLLLTTLSVGYGLVIPLFGMAQTRLLPGPAHWTIEVLHLLIGIGGMFLAARLARYVRQHPRFPRMDQIGPPSHSWTILPLRTSKMSK